MTEFIATYLNEVFSDFKKNIIGEKLCDLRNIRFDGDNLPDYTKINEQQLYILRYFPAYLCEYKYIYKKVIRNNDLTSFNVISIGCGCAVDYYGLFLANNKSIQNITYTGFDLIKWNYRKPLNNQNFQCFEENISAIDLSSYRNCNIMIFPKSLSEFSSTDFNTFISNIKNIQFESKIVYLVSSSMDSGFEYDQARYKQIIDALSEQGYSCNSYEPTKCITEKKGLKKFDPEFDYPDAIRDYIIELNEKCPEYISSGKNCEPECITQLKKWPILKTDHISFQINKLEK